MKLIEGIKANKGVIIKKALIVAGTLIGLAIVDAFRDRKNEEDYDYDDVPYTEVDDEENSPEDE